MILQSSNRPRLLFLTVIGLGVLILWASACTVQPTVQPELTVTSLFQSALLTATYGVPTATFTATPVTPTPTITPSPTPTRTVGPPPTLPATFTTDLIKKDVVPQAYISDTCQYLKNRWDPNKSSPGTVVMPVMYHSITTDWRVITDYTTIKHSELVNTLTHAKERGFQTITVKQLVGFLENNAKIPERSILLIVDDRLPGAIKEHFLPFLEDYNWTVTSAWPIADTDNHAPTFIDGENFANLWEQIESYYATGHVDMQSHGYIHNINITDSSTTEFMKHEMVDSRKVLAEHFYCKDPVTKQVKTDCQTDEPLAYIWPGGSFTKKAAEFARASGYKVGFTVNPRGPVMYNWVPLAPKVDPNYPSYIPEIPVGDPLMVLPRYWSTDAAYRIDEVVNINKQAVASANSTRDAEINYYTAVCEDKYGPIPQSAK